MEVSDPSRVTFQDITQRSGLSNTPNTTASLGSSSQQQSSISGGLLQQQQPTSTKIQSFPGTINPMAIQDTLDPMAVNLAKAFMNLQSLDRQRSPNDSTNLPSTTGFASAKIKTNGTNEEPSSGEAGQQEFLSEEQMLLQILRIAFLHMIARLLRLLGQTPSPTPPPSIMSKEADERQRLRLPSKVVDDSEVRQC